MPAPDPDREDEDLSRLEIMRRAGPYLAIGSTFLASVGLCLFGGWWLDRWLGTSPWLTLIGAFFGIATGFYLFFKTVLHSKEEGPPDSRA